MAEQIEDEEFSSFLSGANALWLEGLLARYQQDPNSVDAEWRSYFASLQEPVQATSGPSWARENWPVAENG